MAKFMDGPAAGSIMALRRAPIMLRVVRNAAGKFDALDQLDDWAEPTEQLFAYVRCGDKHCYHMRSGIRGASGFYEDGSYQLFPDGPDEATMRDNAAWVKWCADHRAEIEKIRPV